MQVTINGTPQALPDGATIADVLALMGRNPRFLAVERNFELVPRTQHAQTVLVDGDVVEIVTLVGGG